jgi:hypothetical protein
MAAAEVDGAPSSASPERLLWNKRNQDRPSKFIKQGWLQQLAKGMPTIVLHVQGEADSGTSDVVILAEAARDMLVESAVVLALKSARGTSDLLAEAAELLMDCVHAIKDVRRSRQPNKDTHLKAFDAVTGHHSKLVQVSRHTRTRARAEREREHGGATQDHVRQFQTRCAAQCASVW